jgi:subtilase family serine protease
LFHNRSSILRTLGLASTAFAALTFAAASKFPPHAHVADIEHGARILITEDIDEHRLVALHGNTRPEARDHKNDRGRLDDGFPMEHMLLQLRRPEELEREFEELIEQLTDKTSPNFRAWLMPAQQGQRFGPAQADLDTVKSWLESHGFTVNYIYPNGMVMDISGTAGQIREAFHTEIHRLEVRGQSHYANMRDPKIPAALAPLIVGVVSMHDFKPQAMNKPRLDDTFAGCAGTCYALSPAEFQVIYNLNPLFRLGLNGTGQTIVLVEDSNSFGTDVATYRNTFLSKYSGTVTTIHPAGGNACADPGTNADDSETDIDAEVASAIAPNAAIEIASCTDTATFGGLLAIENLLASGTPPAIISMSYGECEAFNGAASNAAFNSAFQTGAAAGVSIFVSAGDSGASSCAPLYGSTVNYAIPGVGVTGWGETIYNVSVGGTDFEDTYNAVKGSPLVPVSTYWNSTNTSTGSSVKSYIPEIPWNDSCAGYLLYNFHGFATGYGTAGLCATSNQSIGAGGGGPSSCATGGGGTDQTSFAVVDGSCTGYAKPSWQSGIFGNPADGVRDVPDVSLFAANGLWGHYVIVCYSDVPNGGTSCAGAPSTWSGFGGTSVAAPTMASIQALVNEKWGIRAGNPNPTYYSIAKAEFGSTGNSACYSMNQPAPRGLASDCVFYDITQGDTDVDCRYNPPGSGADGVGCYLPSGTYGVVSTQALNQGTVTAGGSGYTSAPTCTIGAPSNLNKYLAPNGTVLWVGGTQATCTATINAVTHVVMGITINTGGGGSGYVGGASCSLTGGGGTGATCSVSPVMGTIASAFQPAYGSTPGWDFATGIGSVNAYNLVFNTAW